MTKRILVVWWGCLERGGETIGDLSAVVRAAALLYQRGHAVRVASRCPYVLGDLSIPALDWRNIDPGEIDMLVFVCGPIISESAAFRHLFDRFARTQKIAVGVSILPRSEGAVMISFDRIIARDGIDGAHGDFAFDPCEFVRDRDFLDGRVGLCLRGPQREYGDNACIDETTARLTRSITAALGTKAITLDTRLHGRPEAAATITKAFAVCEYIVTSRLHGALMAIALGRQVIAIDQIKGGGKVSSVLNRIGWPLVLRADAPEAPARAAMSVACLGSDIAIDALRIAQASMGRMVGQIRQRLIAAIEDER